MEGPVAALYFRGSQTGRGFQGLGGGNWGYRLRDLTTGISVLQILHILGQDGDMTL